MIPRRFALATLFIAGSAGAQLPELVYQPTDTLDLGKRRFGRFGLVLVGKDRQLVIASEAFNSGEVFKVDTSGKVVPNWGIPIGYRTKAAEIGWLSKWGWIGDSVWIADEGYNQLAILGGDGKIARSVERPAWLRPAWGDRNRYPVFSRGQWEAAYPDGSVLILPQGPRAIFDTPGFDKTGQYLMRMTDDGKLIRMVAKLPATIGFTPGLRLRDVTLRKSFSVPFQPKSVWKVSADGERIVIVEPMLTAQDSGSFRVTTLDSNGDTVWVRRFQSEAARVNQDEVARRLALIEAFGRYSAEWIRDTIRKMTPVFESRVLNVAIGYDRSTWVWIRSTRPEIMGLVIDPTGNAVGWARFPVGTKIVATSVDELLIVKADPRNRFNVQGTLVRYRRAPTPERRSVARARQR